MHRSSRKIALRLLLAAALLLGQFGAQAHAYSHAIGNQQPVDLSSLHTQACNLCPSFAPLLSAVGSTACAPVLAFGDEVRVVRAQATAAAAHRPLLAFRSRAPPVVL